MWSHFIWKNSRFCLKLVLMCSGTLSMYHLRNYLCNFAYRRSYHRNRGNSLSSSLSTLASKSFVTDIHLLE